MNPELSRAEAFLKQLKPNPEKALKSLRPLLKKGKANWLTYHYAGIAELMLENHPKATEYFRRSVKAGSEEPETFHSLSVALFHQGQLDDALEYAKQALTIKPDFFKGWLHLGSIYRDKAMLEDALKCYQKANQLDPKSAGVAFRIGAIYADQGDLEKAMELFDITLKLDENYEEAMIRKGIILQKLRRYEQSEECFQSLIKKQRNHLGATIGLAELNKARGDYDKAVKLYEQVIADYPHMTSILINYALCLQELGHFDESEKNYLKALKSNPDMFQSFSNYLMALHYNPKRTRDQIFNEHLKWDRLFAYKNTEGRPVPENKDPDKKLRIGFISGGFRRHPVGWMIIKALENLSREEFEIYCYTTNNLVDGNTKRIHEASDVWRSVIGYSDQVTANIIRDDKIDILVELSGHSEDNRLQMVSLEPAPVVVKWVGGLFNTTGLESMDYLLTDWYETPEGEEEYYTEKLVRMPDDYICYLKPEYTPEVGPLPAKENGYITFGCFNNPTKINDELLGKWAEILKEVPSSRLFFKSKQYGAKLFTDRIVQKMKGWDVDEDRIIFEGEAPHDQLLDAYNKVDIALDPWPYSGGLSTIEALLMGVPVITLPGPTFAGRHAASHLINTGMGEFVADSWEEYKAMAISLAGDLNKLTEIRKGLRDKLETSPVCDGPRFGAHFGKALRAMWQQRVDGYEQGLREGEWQDHIIIEPISESDIPRKKLTITEGSTAGHSIVEYNADLDDLVITDQFGIRISLPANNEILSSYSYQEQQQWIDPEVELVSELLSEGDSMIDVGAGFGAYALPAARKVGERGAVYAFEVHDEMLPFFEKSKAINKFSQLQIIQKAVSDAEGDVPFDKGVIPELGKLLPSGEQYVHTTTLDACWTEHGKPTVTLLKIDVNGDEPLVLKGAQNLLKDEKPVILISNQDVREETISILAENGYSLYEYIPGTKIINVCNPGENPALLNMLAITDEKAQELAESGYLFNADGRLKEPAKGVWMKTILSKPWAKEISGDWSSRNKTNEEEVYLRILDYICEAESKLKKKNFREYRWVTNMLLTATSTLIELYQKDQNNVPVSFTLARLLNTLGRRDQAVAVLKNITEFLMVGKSAPEINLPFLLPLKEQDELDFRTNYHNWLKVKALESWLLLKEPSTFFLGERETQLLKGLEDNPEVLDAVNNISKTLLNNDKKPDSNSAPKKKYIHIAFNHVYAKCLSDLVEFTNKNSDQEHWLYVNVHRAIADYNADIEDQDHSMWFDSQKHMPVIKERCLEEEVEAVFIHGLFFPWQKELIEDIASRKHVGWIIWGGDLYRPIQEGRPIHEIVKNIDSIHSIIDGDVEVFEQTYGKRPHYSFGYTYPGLYGELPDTTTIKKKKQIVVGNSGDATNKHIEILKVLSEKKDIKEYELLLPVSYNFNKEYRESLLMAIHSFGLDKNVKLLEDFMAPEQYFELINESSMLITAHDRQQAVGNMLMSLYSGNTTVLKKKITVDGEPQSNPTWEFLGEHGLKGTDYETFVKASTISELLNTEKDIEADQEIIRDRFGLDRRSAELVASCEVIQANHSKKTMEQV